MRGATVRCDRNACNASVRTTETGRTSKLAPCHRAGEESTAAAGLLPELLMAPAGVCAAFPFGENSVQREGP
jgi:hypothetical protein